jgi:predicted MFS family arabinose efflux permease
MKRLNPLTFVVQFLIGTDTFLVAPLLPLLTERFGNPGNRAGWMISAYAIGYCVTALFSGPMSDRFDRKHVLCIGMLGFSLATTACGIAWSFPSMIALRFLAGVMAAIGSPQVWAAIPQLVPKNYVVKAMAAPTLGLTVAQIAGVPIGSFLATRSTSDPFYAVGTVSLLATIALSIWFPSVKPTGEHSHLSQQYMTLLHTRHALPRFAAYLVFQTGNFAVMSFIATWLSKDFQLNTQGIGMVMIALGAGNTLGALIGPRIVGHIGQWPVLFLSMGGYVIAYLLLPLGTVLAIPVMILTCTYFIGGVLFPVFMNLLQSLTTTARGTVSALANVLMYLGSTIAGIIGGPLLSTLPGFWSISILATITTIGSALLWKHSTQQSTQR